MVLEMKANQTFKQVLDNAVELLQSGCKELVLDFAQLDYMPSSIIGVIVALDKQFRDRGARLRLRNISVEAGDQFKLFGLGNLILGDS